MRLRRASPLPPEPVALSESSLLDLASIPRIEHVPNGLAEQSVVSRLPWSPSAFPLDSRVNIDLSLVLPELLEMMAIMPSTTMLSVSPRKQNKTRPVYSFIPPEMSSLIHLFRLKPCLDDATTEFVLPQSRLRATQRLTGETPVLAEFPRRKSQLNSQEKCCQQRA